LPAPWTKVCPVVIGHSLLTALTGNPAPVPRFSDIILGLRPEVASEFIALRGEFSICFVHTLLIFFYLAQLVAAKQQLKEARGAAAAGPNKDRIQVERPDKCTNVQKAMGLWNDYDLY